MTTIHVASEIKTSVAITADDGLILFEVLKNLIAKNEECVISFEGIENLSSAFCNASLGKLYAEVGVSADRFIHVVSIDNEVWNAKLQNARKLGINETLRKANDQTIANLFG